MTRSDTIGFAPRDRDWHPPAYTPAYRSSLLRSPRRQPIALDHSTGELTGPVFGHADVSSLDSDLLANFAAPDISPIGERILIHGRVLDEQARPVPNTLVEIWQANASGRYRHKNDSYLGALDPQFGGCGRALTDQQGRYQFRTLKPGAYPWPNGGNDWRPAHVHFSIFGHAYAQRLITQLYFEGDPLIAHCPIVNTIADPKAVDRLIAKLDLTETVPFDMVAYKFDIVLRGACSTVFENRLEGN
ncbi:protocatechuate 3,4-dioxygenase subunit beta [Phaeobacter sp.]|uniref:protocatechuate 3,4-dioxygenase subunit beta n=1 Tax=Phaeobacter sp. TaxID=1902409 RepID=UPI0025FC70BF|nr:protocatechuate 3,4-dioxygenase subunit beta [Phaeobacter sp.]